MREMKICRLCLNTTVVSYSILDPGFKEMLEAVTSVKVDDHSLTEACVKCSLNVKFAYKTQQSIRKSEEHLKQLQSTGQELKVRYINNESMFKRDIQCISCEAIVKENYMEEHIKLHFQDSSTCDMCYEDFPDFICYKEHLLAHAINIVFVCDTCSIEFYSYSLYTEHMYKSHESNPESKKTLKDIKEDIEVHSQLAENGIGDSLAKKLITLSKEKSIKIKTRKRKLQVETIPSMVDFTCEKCPDKKFKTLELFDKHQKRKHAKKTCHICQKQISCSNINVHIRAHENSPKVCQYCGGVYSNSESLRGHILYKHEIKMYKCRECNREFKCRQRYNVHFKKTHTNPQFVCEICAKRFYFQSELKRHVAISHFNERRYVCDFCNQKFSGLDAMKTHRRKHTNETPYKCEFCADSFRQKVSLKSHLRRQHDVVETISAQCKVCGRGFASEHAVKAHVNRVHNSIPNN